MLGAIVLKYRRCDPYLDRVVSEQYAAAVAVVVVVVVVVAASAGYAKDGCLAGVIASEIDVC
jgi:hypothetical protein